MVVANQNSDQLTVFPRNPHTGELTNQPKSYACPAPMCILF
jgi:6-phosphogluconolactonase